MCDEIPFYILRKIYYGLKFKANNILTEYIRVFLSFRSCSLNTKTAQLDSRCLVQRAPSRLYRAAAVLPREIDPRAKYCCPNTCIGPEFIVRATQPSKEIHIKGLKVILTWEIHVSRVEIEWDKAAADLWWGC